MKKNDVPARRRTTINDISALGAELTDEQLRLVSGGAKRRTKNYTFTIKNGNINPFGDYASD